MQKDFENDLVDLVDYVVKWFEPFSMQDCINALVNYLTTRNFNDLMIGDPLQDSAPMKIHRDRLNQLSQRLSPDSSPKVLQALARLLKKTIQDWVAQSASKVATVIDLKCEAELERLKEELKNLEANSGRTPGIKRTIFSGRRPTPVSDHEKRLKEELKNLEANSGRTPGIKRTIFSGRRVSDHERGWLKLWYGSK